LSENKVQTPQKQLIIYEICEENPKLV